MATTFTITTRTGVSYIVTIDDCDSDLMESRWCTQSRKGSPIYVVRGIRNPKHSLRLHRVIMERVLGRQLENTELVDHKNGDGLDNTRANLRVATHAQNMANAKVQKNNKLGLKGVREYHGRYRVDIGVNGKVKYVGIFDTPEIAHSAYIEAANKYHGEFASGGTR